MLPAFISLGADIIAKLKDCMYRASEYITDSCFSTIKIIDLPDYLFQSPRLEP